MSFIDTDDPFSIAAKRIRSSVIRSTPEPQLPIQGKQQPTTYIIEPDLVETQTGKVHTPPDVSFDDAGFAYNNVTGEPVQIIRRPNVLPVARTPDGFTFAMPKILDAAGNIVGGVAAPAVATKAGEVVLGSGAVRTMRNPNKIQIENLINKSEHQELRGLIDDSGVHVWDASKSTHHDTAKELGINYDINNRIHITKPQDEKGFYTLDFDDKWRNPELVKSNPNFVRLLNQDNILVNEPGQGLISGKDFLKLYSDTQPQAANAGELVLGSGAVRTAIKTPKITAPFKKVGLTTLDNYLKANNIPFKKDISKSIGSLSSYYYIDTPTGIKKLRVSDHIGGVGEHANFPLGSSSEEAFNKINEFLGTSLTPEKFDNFKNSLKFEIEDNLKKWQDAKASKKYDSYGPYDYDRPINIFKNQLALFSDTRPQVAAATGHALEKQNQPFFSALERTVDNAKIGKADANQWLGYLKNQPGVKQEELQYVLGNLPEGQISKQALSDIIKNNKIELKEKVLGSDTKHIDVKLDELQPLVNKMIQENNKLGFDSIGQARSAIRTYNPADWEFNNSKDLALAIEYHKLHQSKLDQIPTKYHDYQLPGGERYQEMLLTLPINEIKYGKDPIKNLEAINNTNFQSSHWDEPNIIAHVRYNDRMVDGKKTLHLEEIQSDWHQKGRNEGYKLSDKQRKDLDTIENKLTSKLTEAEIGNPDIDNVLKVAVDKKIITPDEARNYKDYVKGENSTVPDAPFKKNWDELALKRMLHKAATEGYEGLSWTPGEAQAARYDLSKQISKLQYFPGRQRVQAFDKNGNPVIDKEGIKPDQLPDIVGKEVANKLLSDEFAIKKNFGDGGILVHEMRNADLKIGGEGMKSFYDKMLVDKANALAKKYGAKVETKEIPIDAGKPTQYKNFEDWQKAVKEGRTQPVHVLKLTPKLRAKAKEGFPLFSSTPITTPVDYDPFNNNKKYKLIPIEGNPFQ